MADEAIAIGRRISEARERSKLTQQELGSRAGLERSVIAKIERGLRGVGAIELVGIAEALGQRIEWLLSDAPAAVVAHRTRLDPTSDIATIDRFLETLARHTEFVASLAPSLFATELPLREVPKSGSEADALAKEARAHCGLSHGEPARNLTNVMAQAGLIAFSAPLGAETADAASLLLERGAVAVINSTNAVGRRRIALAHELGHYLVQDDYNVDWRVSEHSDSDRTEVLLDRFAREFLAPGNAFEEFWSNARDGHDLRTSAVLTGSHFQIDMATIARRLQELSITSSDEARSIRSVQTSKADIVEYGLLVPVDLTGTTVPDVYAQAVLALYKAERISSERARELLLGTFGPEDLPELPDAHENEIWSIIR